VITLTRAGLFTARPHPHGKALAKLSLLLFADLTLLHYPTMLSRGSFLHVFHIHGSSSTSPFAWFSSL
jgi:hypothetical protein